MTEMSSIVASGIVAMRGKADAHAQNIANARTRDHERLGPRTTERPEGGVDLSIDRTAASSESITVQDPYSFEGSAIANNDVDLAEEMLGMNEAARGIEMLVAVYQRQDAALGSLFDAFG